MSIFPTPIIHKVLIKSDRKKVFDNTKVDKGRIIAKKNDLLEKISPKNYLKNKAKLRTKVKKVF